MADTKKRSENYTFVSCRSLCFQPNWKKFQVLSTSVEDPHAHLRSSASNPNCKEKVMLITEIVYDEEVNFSNSFCISNGLFSKGKTASACHALWVCSQAFYLRKVARDCLCVCVRFVADSIILVKLFTSYVYYYIWLFI